MEEVTMLAAEGMLRSLSGDDKPKGYKNHNNDCDFGEVLQYCSDDTVHNRKIMCSDGCERSFSFDD